MDHSVTQLRAMVKNLPDLIQSRGTGHVEYQSDGTILGLGIWKQDKMAAQRAFIAKGSALQVHIHEQHEFLLVYEGALEVSCECASLGNAQFENGVTHIGVAGAVYIPPGMVHEVRAVENTWCLGITIPADAGYPDTKEV